MAVIYALKGPRGGAVRYIGYSAVHQNVLLSHHIQGAKNGRDLPVSRWIRKLLAHGERPVVEVLKRGATYDDEIAAITTHRAAGRRLLNTSAGGPGCRRRKTDAERKRQSYLSKQHIQRPGIKEHLSECAKRQWAEPGSRLCKASTSPEAIAKRAAANKARWKRWRNKRFPPAMQKAIVDRIAAGASVRGLSKEIGVSRDTIKTLVKVHSDG